MSGKIMWSLTSKDTSIKETSLNWTHCTSTSISSTRNLILCKEARGIYIQYELRNSGTSLTEDTYWGSLSLSKLDTFSPETCVFILNNPKNEEDTSLFLTLNSCPKVYLYFNYGLKVSILARFLCMSTVTLWQLTDWWYQVFKEEEEAVKVELHEGCGRIKLYWTMALADYRTLKGLIEFREASNGERVYEVYFAFY